MTDNFERRMVKSTLQFRAAAAGSNSPGILEGYAAKFNTYSGDLGGFIECIKPGAFTRALKLKQDVRALQNHDPNLVLGRTTSGTLSLIEDSIGLKFKVILPNTMVGRDAFTLVSRKDVTGCSFAFKVANAGENWTNGPTGAIRELTDLDLFDVSPVVTYPAYADTNVSANAMELLNQSSIKISPRALVEARNRGGVVRRTGVPVVLMDEDDKNQVRQERGRKLAEHIRADSDDSDTEDDDTTEFNGPTVQKELCNRCFSSGVKRVGQNQFYCGSCGSTDPYKQRGK
jgi:Escherichia/Staphylococcus phage prohead protease